MRKLFDKWLDDNCDQNCAMPIIFWQMSNKWRSDGGWHPWRRKLARQGASALMISTHPEGDCNHFNFVSACIGGFFFLPIKGVIIPRKPKLKLKRLASLKWRGVQSVRPKSHIWPIFRALPTDAMDQILTIMVAKKYLSHLTGATHNMLDVIASDKELYTSLHSVVVKTYWPG